MIDPKDGMNIGNSDMDNVVPCRLTTSFICVECTECNAAHFMYNGKSLCKQHLFEEKNKKDDIKK